MEYPGAPPLTEYIVSRDPPEPAFRPAVYFPPPPAPTVYVAPRPAPGPKKATLLACILQALLIVLVVVIAVCLLWPGGRRGLAGALAARGWVLYTRPGCSFSDAQLEVLGVRRYPKQVVCLGEAAKLAPGVRPPYPCRDVPAFPFWANEYTSASRVGLQEKSELREMVRFPAGS